MPAADALMQGRWALTLCPATGPLPVMASDHSTVADHGGHHDEQHSDHHSSPHDIYPGSPHTSHRSNDPGDHQAGQSASTSHAAGDHEPGSLASKLSCPFSLIAHLSLSDVPAVPGVLPIAVRAAPPSRRPPPIAYARAIASAPLGARAPPLA